MGCPMDGWPDKIFYRPFDRVTAVKKLVLGLRKGRT